jgi:hypothetical protein
VAWKAPLCPTPCPFVCRRPTIVISWLYCYTDYVGKYNGLGDVNCEKYKVTLATRFEIKNEEKRDHPSEWPSHGRDAHPRLRLHCSTKVFLESDMRTAWSVVM